LLFPANTQWRVHFHGRGDFFALDTVTLDRSEGSHQYYIRRAEVEALLRLCAPLYLGNLKVGKHELVAFSVQGPNDRDYKRGATLKFEKGIGAKYLELKSTPAA